MQSFTYDEAFSRNIGWLTRQEQDSLRHQRVAIAGLGGVGGFHLLTLCRLGISKFNLADFDSFDLANRKRSSTILACQLCVGFAAPEALKILLGRSPAWPAPKGCRYKWAQLQLQSLAVFALVLVRHQFIAMPPRSS